MQFNKIKYGGVYIDDIGKGKNRIEKIENIVVYFNDAAKKLIQIAKLSTTDQSMLTHISKIQYMYKISESKMPDFAIMQCFVELTKIENQSAILNKDFNFFIKKKYNKYLNKQNEDIIQPILSMVKTKFNTLEAAEQNQVWELVGILSICSAEYSKLVHPRRHH